MGAEILITNDANGFKTVADGLELDHQVCKDRVKRNTEMLVESLESAAAQDEDGYLSTIGVTLE